MLTGKVREWLKKVERGQYSYDDAMSVFSEFSAYLTKDEIKMILAKLKNYYSMNK